MYIHVHVIICTQPVCCSYSDEVRNNFHVTLDWLHEHACSRVFGLGQCTLCSPIVVELASPNVVELASPNVVELASPNVVELASPNVVELASPIVVELASPIVVKLASPIVCIHAHSLLWNPCTCIHG